jgi:predicted GIY-YIG superfamily endonuclease
MPYYIYRIQGYDENNKNTNYVGSTPNPKRRIRQHNKIITGGAKFTGSKIDKLTVNEKTSLKWNFQWLLMTFFNKNLALSLEWHMKHPFSFGKKLKKFDKKIDMMMLQIDMTIKCFLQKRSDLINKNNQQIFLFIDDSIIITYKPDNFKVVKMKNINNAVIEYGTFEYFNEL